MFHKIFSRGKISNSIKKISLNGKIIIGHCKGHDTIILIALIDGFKERQLYFVVKKYVGGKYWCFVNKKVVYDFFYLLPTFNHLCL